jgi:hypothetical protein
MRNVAHTLEVHKDIRDITMEGFTFSRYTGWYTAILGVIVPVR